MDRRMKILYGITIVSLVLLMIIQGYWLVGQYDYALQKYEDELYEKTMKAFNTDRNLRNTIRAKDGQVNYYILSHYYFDMNKTECSSRWIIDILANRGKPFTSRDSSAIVKLDPIFLSRHHVKRYTFAVNVTSNEFSITNAENMFITNNRCPFTVARFDSILKSKHLSA